MVRVSFWGNFEFARKRLFQKSQIVGFKGYETYLQLLFSQRAVGDGYLVATLSLGRLRLGRADGLLLSCSLLVLVVLPGGAILSITDYKVVDDGV